MAASRKNAEEHLAAAAKAVKTSMFKWKPDWEVAAEEYMKAGQQFVLAKDKEKALEAFKSSGKAFEEWGMSKYNAAKAYENASNAARDLKMFDECSQLIRTAAALYRREGKADQACQMQEKAAKDAEKAGKLEFAMELYLDVVEVREVESQTRRIKQPLDRAVQLAIRSKNFKKASELLEKEATVFISLKDDPMLHRNWLCRMIVKLAAGKFDAADALYDEAITSSFAVSDEQFAADQMLNAYDEADQEKLAEVTRQQIFSFLSNDVAVLARKLEARGGNGRSDRLSNAMQEKMDAVSPPTPKTEVKSAPVAAPTSAPQSVETSSGGDDRATQAATTEVSSTAEGSSSDAASGVAADSNDNDDELDDLL